MQPLCVATASAMRSATTASVPLTTAIATVQRFMHTLASSWFLSPTHNIGRVCTRLFARYARQWALRSGLLRLSYGLLQPFFFFVLVVFFKKKTTVVQQVWTARHSAATTPRFPTLATARFATRPPTSARVIGWAMATATLRAPRSRAATTTGSTARGVAVRTPC